MAYRTSTIIPMTPNTGNLNSHTDENNKTTGYSYDVLGRVTSIQYPDGGGSTFCYTDIGGSICPQGTAPFSLYTSTIASPDPPITTTHTYDGWGRQYRSSITSDPLGATIVGTTYDWEGRVTSVSNPYRSTPAPNDPHLALLPMYTTRLAARRSRRNRTAANNNGAMTGLSQPDRPTARVWRRVLVDLPCVVDGMSRTRRDGTRSRYSTLWGTWAQ